MSLLLPHITRDLGQSILNIIISEFLTLLKKFALFSYSNCFGL